jgi:hypothetical protein
MGADGLSWHNRPAEGKTNKCSAVNYTRGCESLEACEWIQKKMRVELAVS